MTTARRFIQSQQRSPVTRRPWLLSAALCVAALTANVALNAGVLMSVNTPAASPGVPIQITGTGFSAIAAQNVLTVTPISGSGAQTAAATAVQTLDATRGIRRLNVVVPAGLPAGAATLRVTNSATGEISEGLTFHVVLLTASGITTAAPGAAGVEVIVEGSSNAQFTTDGNTRVTVGAGITVRSVTVHTPQRLTAVLDVAPSAALGPRPLAVRPPNQFLLLQDGFVVGSPPPVNRDPRFTSTPVVQAVAGQVYSSNVQAVDDDGDQITFALQQSPTGMTLVAGALHWTPAPSQTGSHQVSVVASDGRGGSATQSFEVLVAAPPLVGITLQPSHVRFTTLNDTRQLSVSGLRADGSTVDLTAGSTGTTYQTSNGAVASVGSSAVVTSLGNGETTVTARHLSFSATAHIVVEQGVTLDALELTPATTTLRATGATQELTLRGSFSDGSQRDVTADAGTRYQTADESVATVNDGGVVTAVGSGVVTITATHDTRNATAEVRVVLASGQGFVRGQVFDDSRGLPLAGATVTLLADGGGPYDQPPNTIADDRGRYVLTARSGDLVVRVTREGFTAVERHGTLNGTSRVRLLDARLTPLDAAETPIRSAFGGSVRSAAGEVTIDVPPGALAGDTTVRVTAVGAQGLAARLPIGWSPIASVDIAPVAPLFQPSLLAVPNASSLPAGTAVAVVSYDTAEHVWRVAGTAQIASDGRTISTMLTATGQIAFIVADDAPFTPPAPVVAQPLAGTDPAALPMTAEARGEVVPRSAPPGPSARALGRIGLASAQALPSGTALQVHVNEAFDLLDTSRVVPLPFTQDILVHARPRPPSGSRLGASFPITPSRLYTIQQLIHGVITLDVTPPVAEAGGGVIGAAGGTLASEQGDLLIVPSGALQNDALVSVQRLTAPVLPPGFPATHEVLAAVDVDFVGASFAVPAQLSIARPGHVTAGDQVLIAQRLLDPNGVQRLRIVGTGSIEGDRLVSQHTPGSLPLAGITTSAQYIVIRLSAPLGFISGIVTGPDGTAPVASALVTSDTAPFADITDTAGRYLVGGAAAVDTRVSVVHLTTLDATQGLARVPAVNGLVSLPLSLAIVPPSVVATDPAADAANVPLDSSIAIEFSEAIDPATVTDQSVSLRAAGNAVTVARVLSQDRRRLVLSPAAPLTARTTYSIVLTADVRDVTGTPLAAFTTRTFSTLDPTRPPQPPPGQIVAALPDADGLVAVAGTAGTAEARTPVTATNLRTQETATVMALDDGSFRLWIAALVGDEISLTLRDASGRETTVALHQFEGSEGRTSIGVRGGTIVGANGRIGSVLPRALTAAGIFSITEGSSDDVPVLPSAFAYADRFTLTIEGAAFSRLTSLTLTESQGRFDAFSATAAPFSATGELTVPADFLTNSVIRYTAVAQDATGNRRTASISTTVVATNPDRSEGEGNHTADFPTVWLRAPREAVASQVTGAVADVPTARIDLRVPAPALVPGADTFLLARRVVVGADLRLALVDQLVRNADGQLRSAGRRLPGMTTGGEYVVVRSSEPLVFITGTLPGATGLVEADGLPFVFDTGGPNGTFAIPARAGEAFTLRFMAADGSLRGTVAGVAPESGTSDIGNALTPTGAALQVSVEPAIGSVVDISTAVTFRFSGAVDPRTLAAGIVISDAAGGRVYGTFSLSDGGRTATFRPTRRWRFGTQYRYGVSPSILGLDGGRLATPLNGTFQTFAPLVAGTTPVGEVVTVDGTVTIAVSGSNSGMQVLDISSPRAPIRLSHTAMTGGVRATAYAPALTLTARTGTRHVGAFAVTVSGDAGTGLRLQLFGVGTPAAPVPYGSIPLTMPGAAGAAADLAIVGDRALVAIEDVGMIEVHLGQLLPDAPADPALAIAARYPATGAEDVTGADTLLTRVVAAGSQGLSVHNGSTLIRDAVVPGAFRDVAGVPSFVMDVNGDSVLTGGESFDLAVATGGPDGTLQFFRIPASGAPVLLSVVRLPGETTSVTVDATERLAFVGLGARGVGIVDLDGPASLQPIDLDRNGADDRILAVLDTGGVAHRVVPLLERGLALVANGPAGVTVVQILPVRSRFVSLRRDPARAISGDEQDITASREALTTDDAVLVDIEAFSPDGTGIVAVLNGTTGTGASVFSMGSEHAPVPLAAGRSTIAVALDRSTARDGDTAVLSIRTTTGTPLASVAFRLRAPGVNESAPLSLRIVPARVMLGALQREMAISVLATLPDGRVVNVSSAANGTTYRIDNTAVASVSPDGVVRGVAGGSTVLTATLGALSASAVVTVDAPAEVARLELERAHLTLTAPGQVAALPLRILLSDGSVHTGDPAALGIVFTSLTPTIVSIDASGRVTALADGLAMVTASRGSQTVSVQVAVAFRTGASVTAITLEPFTRPAGTDHGSADARAVLTGTGSLEGTEVTFTVGGRTVTTEADYNGVAALRLGNLTTVGTFTVTSSVVDPATGTTRSSSQPVQVVGRGQDVEPNDSAAAAVPVELRRPVRGTLSAADPADFYRINTSEGGTLNVTLRLASSETPPSARIRILDLGGAGLNQIAAGAGTTRLAQVISAGSVVVAVEYVSGEPSYQLSIDLDQAPVTIGSVNPLAGGPGTTVTITGSGFSLEPRRNAVYFGKVGARIVSSSDTTIEAVVPFAALDGPVEVIASARRAAGPSFVVGRQGRPLVRLEPHAPAAVRHDPVNHELVVIDRLSVYVDPGTSRAEVDAIAASTNGRVVGVNEVVHRYVLEFPDLATLPALHARRRLVSTDPRVRFVNTYTFLSTEQPAVSDLERSAARFTATHSGVSNAIAQIGFVEAFQAIRQSDRFRAGLRPVRVAVLDSGFDPGPYAGDFQTNTGTPLWSMQVRLDDDVFEGYGAHDREGHGTSVVSIIAALNNGNEVSGILGSFYTPFTANFDILIYGYDSPLDTAPVERVFALSLAIDALTEIGLAGNVDVLNLSLGVHRTGDELATLRREFGEALRTMAGRTLVVASAGNEGARGFTHVPSGLEDELPFLISVGGTATLTGPDGRAPKGRWRDLSGTPDAPEDALCETGGLDGSGCAPGVNIAAPAESILALRPGGVYGFGNGVSYATPMVSATAALLIALRGNDAALLPDQLRTLLVESAEDIDASWEPDGMRLLNIREAVRPFIDPPTNQRVYVADQDAANGAGHVVTMEVDPLAGTRRHANLDQAVPLTLERGDVTHRFRRPASVAIDPAGQWAYVVVSSEDASIGDGILVISTARNVAEDFIAFSGASLLATPGMPRPPPVRSSAGRRTIVTSKDGRLLYAATGLAITIINLAEGRVVQRLEDLPAVYRGAVHLSETEALATRRNALAQLLAAPIAGRPAVSISSLDISADGSILFAAVSTGGGAGLQPGALLSITVNLYADVTALQFGLQSDLGQFFVNATLAPMSGAPGSSAQGDEPGVVVAGQANSSAYLVNGGLDGFSTVTGTQDYMLLIDLFGVVQLGRLEGELGIGSTVIRAPGQTGLFTSAAGALQNVWSFPANLNFAMRPPNAGPVTHLPDNHPEVFASRPFSMAMRPDGERAIVPMFQTGNFGVLDLDIQNRLLPRNPALASLPPNAFHGLVGVTEAVRLDPHLWPSCGVIGSGLNADVPSPDEALLFAWDAVYAQNGRFAVATHSGSGGPRQVRGTVPNFSQPPGSFVLNQLGFSINGETATNAEGQAVQAGDTLTFLRGGGAITFIDDTALSAALDPDGLRERTPLPVVATDPSAGNRCPSLRPGRVLGFGPTPDLTTRFHRPRGVGIQPFVFFESPRFGDHIAASQTIYIGWRDARVSRLQMGIEDLDSGDTTTVGLPMTPADVAARSLSMALTTMFGAEDFLPGQRLRLTLTAHATETANGQEREFSKTSIDVTITDGGGRIDLEMSPALLVVPAVPNTAAPRDVRVTMRRPDGTSTDVTASSTYQWIGQGLAESSEPEFAATRAALRQALGVLSIPIATLSVSPAGSVTVQQPGIQLIRASHEGVEAAPPVLVLAGFDVRAIEINPEAPLTGPVTLTDLLRAREPNAPLLLAEDGAGSVPDRSTVVLSDVFFGFLGQGRIGLETLLDAVSRVTDVDEQTTVGGRLREFLRIAGWAGNTPAPLTYSVVPRDGAVGTSIDLSCANGIDTNTCVNAAAPGTSLVRGVLDLTAIGMGRAADHVLTVVFPPIESAAIEPATSVVRRSDSPAAGPTIRTFARLGALPNARFAVPTENPSAEVFASELLPPSWLAANGQVAIDVPGATSVRFDFGLQRATADVTITGLATTFAVPNDAAPDVVNTYTVDAPGIATLAPVDRFRTRIRHQNLAGSARITNPVTITGLGTATATADVIVCDCSGLALVKRLTSGATAVSSGDVVSYEITAANSTSATISNVVITDELRFGQLLVSRTTLPAFSLAAGESRSFPITVTAPFYGTTIFNTATATGFTATQPPPVTVLAPASTIVITEMVLNPRTDWNDSAGGNGVPFDYLPGSGAVDAADIWIEVTGATTSTQNWTVRITDTSGATASVPIGPINVSAQVRVLSGFTGVTLPIVRVEVVDAQGIVRQTLDIPAIEQVIGGATGTNDEALTWSVFGSATPLLQQFTRRPATPGGFQPF